MSTAYANGELAIAVCDRCNYKYPYRHLRPDGNSPGLRVCAPCWDMKDPWRLPPIKPDPLVMRFPRPDVSIAVQPNPVSIPIPPVEGDFIVTEQGFTIVTEDGIPIVVESGTPPPITGTEITSEDDKVVTTEDGLPIVEED